MSAVVGAEIVRQVLSLVLFLLIGGTILRVYHKRGLVADTRTVILASCLVGGYSIGQGLPDNRFSYPFVRWSMYASAFPPRGYRDYTFVDSTGQAGRYPFGVLLFSSRWPLQARLDQLAAACRCRQRDPSLDRAIGALDRVYQMATGRHLLSFAITAASTSPNGHLARPSEPYYRWTAPRGPDTGTDK
jgi:hypothetical protein